MGICRGGGGTRWRMRFTIGSTPFVSHAVDDVRASPTPFLA